MAKWGNCDFKQLQKLQENFDKLNDIDMQKFSEACIKELAARLLGLVIPITPVGKYPAVKKSGKKGGTLRRGWGAKNAQEAKSYVDNLTITKTGTTYQIEIINPVDYASYVEYGHRTRGGGGMGWVPGQYMLTISEQKLEQATPAILERKLQEKLKEVFNV